MTPSVRFVHSAGFRFDSRSWEGPVSWIEMRNLDLWQTFEALLNLCHKEQADFLFLTGDLFEQELVGKETVERVAKSLARLKDTRIFITPGERDPLVTASAYRLTDWPDNVHIFSRGISHIEIPARGVTIYGAGWTTYQQEKAYPDDFQIAGKPGQIQFMLLHAEVESEQNTEGFIPLKQEHIASSGLTYLALGHREHWSGIQQEGETYWADCGWPEARSFSADGPHGVLLGETDGKSTSIKFLELGQRRYIEKSVMLQDSDIMATVAQLLSETTPQERQRDLFRLKLTGFCHDPEGTIQTLQKLLADEFSYLEILFGPNVDGADTLTGSKSNGYPGLVEVFADEIFLRLAAVHGTLEQRHWEIVQKIGLAALGQGRGNNEN